MIDILINRYAVQSVGTTKPTLYFLFPVKLKGTRPFQLVMIPGIAIELVYQYRNVPTAARRAAESRSLLEIGHAVVITHHIKV